MPLTNVVIHGCRSPRVTTRRPLPFGLIETHEWLIAGLFARRAQGRHNMRPAHLHFLACKEGFKTLISQLYVQDDRFIDSDVQFGVTRHLIGNYVRHERESAGCRRERTVVFARAHLPPWKRAAPTAAAADHRKGAAASGPKIRIWREARAESNRREIV